MYCVIFCLSVKSVNTNLVTVTELLEMKKTLASLIWSGQRKPVKLNAVPLIEKTVAALSA